MGSLLHLKAPGSKFCSFPEVQAAVIATGHYYTPPLMCHTHTFPLRACSCPHPSIPVLGEPMQSPSFSAPALICPLKGPLERTQ